jgi:hypothetical protein
MSYVGARVTQVETGQYVSTTIDEEYTQDEEQAMAQYSKSHRSCAWLSFYPNP